MCGLRQKLIIAQAVAEQKETTAKTATATAKTTEKRSQEAESGASATFSKDFIAPLICEEAKLAIGEAGHFVKDMAVVKTMPLGGIWAER